MSSSPCCRQRPTDVVVDLSGAIILHDATNYDTISSLTVTATKVTLDLGAGTLDLSGGGGRGTFQVDQNGDAVTMEAGVLANADVTSGTTLSATSDDGGVCRRVPELDDVQLDGTLNANQSGQDNGFYFTNGLILNGTINLGGNKDLSSVILAGLLGPVPGQPGQQPRDHQRQRHDPARPEPERRRALQLGHAWDLHHRTEYHRPGGGPGSIGLIRTDPLYRGPR